MKRFTFLILLSMALFACSKNDEQIPVITDTDFNIVYGGSSQQVYAATRNSDGAYILAGFAKNESNNSTDAWVLKMDRQGKLIWQKNFGGSGFDGAYAIANTKDGGNIIAGFTYSNDGDVTGYRGNGDAWVVKLDNNGNKQWQTTLGGSASEHASSIAETNDGGFIVAGQTASTDGDVSNNQGGIDVWIIKLDKSGIKQWQKTFGGSASEGASSVIQTSDGGYIMAGWTYSNDGDVMGYHAGWGMWVGNFDGWVIKLNKDGQLIWNKAYGGSRNETFNSIIESKNNSYIIAGNTKSSGDGDVGVNHGDNDAWILNIDRDGKIIWQKTVGGSNGDYADYITSTSDGGYMLAGHTSSNDGDVSGNHGGVDAWVVKLDQGGNKVWQRTLGGSANDVARVVFERTNGSYVMVGSTGSTDGDLTGVQNSGGVWVISFKQ
jgi:hypothetical protein